jgi:hypothetical protein
MVERSGAEEHQKTPESLKITWNAALVNASISDTQHLMERQARRFVLHLRDGFGSVSRSQVFFHSLGQLCPHIFIIGLLLDVLCRYIQSHNV